MLPAPLAASSLDHQQLLTSLLACAAEALPLWLDAHRPQLTLAFLQALKDTYAVTTYILAEPVIAEQATRYGLLVAVALTDEPLALPVAQWARGLWAMFHAPEAAVTLFQQAQAGYRAVGDMLSVARLNANLVGVLAECGRFAEAEVAYQAARPEFLLQVTANPLYLVRLEQNYGWLLHSQGRYGEALAILDQALDLAQRNQLTTSITGIQVNRHLALGMLGRLDEVEAGFVQERATALAHGQLVTVARIDMNLGDLYAWQGRVAAGLHAFQQAQQAFMTLGNAMEIASVRFRQAALLSRIGAWRAAIRHYAQALPHFAEQHMLPQMGELLVNHAIAHRHEGEYRKAATLLTDADAIWHQLENPLWLAMVALERVALALAQGAYATAQQLLQDLPALTEALRLHAEWQLLQAELSRLTADGATAATTAVTTADQRYHAAHAYALAHGEQWIERRALVGLGKLWLAVDPARATAYFEQAATIDQRMRQMLTVEELKASFHEQANDLFDDLIILAIEEHQAQQALAYSWRAKAGALLDLLQAVHEGSRLASSSAAAIEETRQQIATLRWQLATQADPTLPSLLQTVHTGRMAALEQQLLDLRRHRNNANSGFSSSLLEAHEQPTMHLAQMDADLLLEYVRCGDEIWGISADRQGRCEGRHLIDVETIIDLHARLQLRFGNVVGQPPERRRQWHEQWLAECLPLLKRCYEALVAPLLATRPAAERATKLLIAPCDPLFLFPFAAFWTGAQFLGDRYQIERIPSGALLGQGAPSVAAHSPAIIIGAATGAMTAVRREANMIAATLPTSIAFVDTPALAYLRTLAAPPHLLHIAAHSLLRADAPLFTGLQLSGEVLTVEQCYELPLHGTELVTLSGCATASGQESESALLAFQTAFLLAGAQRVITTLWPIADDATARWMVYFYGYLTSGLTVPQALQRTQQRCLADADLCHPALWAPFVVTRR